MYISDFNYHRPSSLEEACRILVECPDAVPIAGGTDLLVEMKQGLRHHANIVSLADIEELRSIRRDQDELVIGAGATHNEVARSPIVRDASPALAEAAASIGSDQIRNTATLGGNLCTGASCCDMAPILMAQNAKVELQSIMGSRTVTVDEFFISHRETRIKKGEVLKKVTIPSPPGRFGACFVKYGLREAASISVASVAVCVGIDECRCAYARVVIGAVAPTPKISTGANELLTGRTIGEITKDSPLLRQVGAAAAADALPIDDIRGSAEYRRHLIGVLTPRAILRALERASECGASAPL